jgi:hypothetical protein
LVSRSVIVLYLGDGVAAIRMVAARLEEPLDMGLG